jgi:DNA replication protein DnaC
MMMEASKLINIISKETKTDNCSIHGDFESISIFKAHWTTCPQCQEIRINEQKQKEQVEREIQDKERSAKLLEKKIGQAALPKRFKEAFLLNYVADCPNSIKALKTCFDYVESFDENLKNGSCLILCGMLGNGKTHLAVGIAHEILRIGFQPLFCTVAKALRFVKSTYNRDSEKTEREALETFIDPDLLILDEVGVQFGSETEKNIMFEIINGRYEQVKPTIIISNLAKDELEKFFGERSFDRLREGGGKIIIFDWKSYRTKI